MTERDRLPVRRVRAILLTKRDSLLFIARHKPDRPPYWVAPGGGLHAGEDLEQGLRRELREELGAEVDILQPAFVLRHRIGCKDLEEHFFVCRLLTYDLELRDGPEFGDPSRGSYEPAEAPFDEDVIAALPLKTTQLQDWLLAELPLLQQLSICGVADAKRLPCSG